MTTPTIDQIDAILKYLPAFGRPKLLKSKWRGGDKDNNGVITLPWEEPSPTVCRFREDLSTRGLVQSFNWPDWHNTARKYVEEPQRLRKATLLTLCKLLTTHVRKDRFCEGHFTGMIKCGQIKAIMDRLADLRGELRSEEASDR